MTVSEIISRADAIRPNTVPMEIKLGFLSDVEGQVRVLICEESPNSLKPIGVADVKKVLTVPYPFDSIYVYYLCAMYAWYTENTELYANDRAVFEKFQSEYAKWYLRSGGGVYNGRL